ncbi:uncharacterized protein C1orf159 homolog isoform X8 [Equus asinus]|uniref:uncharacterized protein C1orf159 homolog isoform X8 n=1 Tax=Equus asinus TaxID=9793 RepID=UPI0038F6E544
MGLGIAPASTRAGATERLQVPEGEARPPGGRGVRKRNPEGARKLLEGNKVWTIQKGSSPGACTPPPRVFLPKAEHADVLVCPLSRVVPPQHRPQRHLPAPLASPVLSKACPDSDHRPARIWMSAAHVLEGQTLCSRTWHSSAPFSWPASWWKLPASPQTVRLLQALERGREHQLCPVQEWNLQQFRVQRPCWPGCTVPGEQEHRDAWAAKFHPCPAAWRSCCDDPPAAVLSAEAALRQA